ncbi:MAG: AP2 domain-containing protein, partial [Endozoicomonas sp.]
MSGKPEDITGLKVNRLTAVSFSHRNTQGQRLWLCRCDCGADTYSTVGALKRGHKKSCGCLKIELFKKNATKHGMSGTGEYSIWEHVIQRCTNPNNDRYSKYGGRGIKVCKRWMSFESFIFDMGPRPTQKHSIDRIDNNKGYSPSNCKWSTHTEQARNTGMFKNNTTGVKGVH